MRPSSWCLIDIDATVGMPEHLADLDGEGRREKLAEVISGFDACGIVVLPSTTGRVKLDGVPMDATGQHLYFQLQDPYDLERFGKVLLQRSTIKGYGFQKPLHDKETNEIMGYRAWSIADPTTFNHGRLVYDGSPTVKGKGLSIADTVTHVIEGGRLDSSALTDLSEAEAAAYRAETGQSVRRERRTVTNMGADGVLTKSVVQVYVTVDDTKLKLDTVIETKSGPIVLMDYWKGKKGHTRCQTPFRVSSSENGILNRHKDGTPFVYDNGTHIRYTLSDAEREAGEEIIYAEKLEVLFTLIRDAELEKEIDKKTVIDAVPLVEAFANIKFLSAVEQGRAEKRASKVLDCGVKAFQLDVKQARKSLTDSQDNHVQPEGTTLVVMHKPLSVARTLIEEKFTTSKLTTLLRCKDDFYTFNDVCYQEMSEAGMRSKLYEFLEGCVIKDASGFIEVNPKSHSVSEVMDALKADAHLDDELSPPCWIDGNDNHPPSKELLICKNGLLHMPTRKLSPLNPGFFSLNALTYGFDPDAPEPEVFHNFLDDLFGDDPEAEDLMQEMFGYTLSGNTSFQKIMAIVGPKRAGKGVMGRLLTALVGKDNVCNPSLGSFSNAFPHEPLIGKTLALMSDARLSSSADQKAIVEHMLRVSGEDDVNVTRKNKTDWSGRLSARFMLLTNEVPRLADASGAFAGRFVTLVLTKSFYGKEDPRLTDRLLTELPGILNWALEGWDRLQKQGRFTIPSSSLEVMKELEYLSSPILKFIDDTLIFVVGEEMSVDDVFTLWTRWCLKEGRNYTGTKATFGRDLNAAYPELVKIRKNLEGDRPYYYKGIAPRYITERMWPTSPDSAAILNPLAKEQ